MATTLRSGFRWNLWLITRAHLLSAHASRRRFSGAAPVHTADNGQQPDGRTGQSNAVKTRNVRGTHDLFGQLCADRRAILSKFVTVAESACCSEVSTPVLEHSEIFRRTLGVGSDVVSKEMFTMEDGGDDICLRPENTASIMRAVIASGRSLLLPQRLYYSGLMFRRERPQKGRYREFGQMGVELLGMRGPMADAEAVAMASQFLAAVGVQGSVRLHISTIGSPQARREYARVLASFLRDRGTERLSADSQRRLEDGHVLRILDSKAPEDNDALKDAPRLYDALDAASRDRFEAVLTCIRAMSLPCEVHVDWRLVRGLDYYNDTVFEFVTDALGAQGTVLAGGRYDGLAQAIGGAKQQPISAVGWAAGMERLAMLARSLQGGEEDEAGADECAGVRADVAVVEVRGGPPATCLSSGDAVSAEAMRACLLLRAAGMRTMFHLEGNASRQFIRAAKDGARVAVVVGDGELAGGTLRIKDLITGRQWDIPRESLVDAVRASLVATAPDAL